MNAVKSKHGVGPVVTSTRAPGGPTAEEHTFG